MIKNVDNYFNESIQVKFDRIKKARVNGKEDRKPLSDLQRLKELKELCKRYNVNYIKGYNNFGFIVEALINGYLRQQKIENDNELDYINTNYDTPSGKIEIKSFIQNKPHELKHINNTKIVYLLEYNGLIKSYILYKINVRDYFNIKSKNDIARLNKKVVEVWTF